MASVTENDAEELQRYYEEELYIKSDLSLLGNPAEVAFLHGNGWYVGHIARCGVQLYENNNVRWLLILGGVNTDLLEGTRIEEGITIKEALMNYGVPRSRILVDVESTNTKENAIAARHLIELGDMQLKRNPEMPTLSLTKVERIVVVAASFHARRAVMTVKRWVADGKEKYEYYPYPYVPYGLVNERGTLTEYGRNKVRQERNNIPKYRDKPNPDIVEIRKVDNAYEFNKSAPLYWWV